MSNIYPGAFGGVFELPSPHDRPPRRGPLDVIVDRRPATMIGRLRRH